MAFSYSNAVSGGGAFGGGSSSSGAPTVRDGPELREVQTDKLGFSAINGTAKVRLLPSPWPSDALPPPSASLLAVASRKGLLAAAGPDGIYLASTESVRAAFREKNTESESDTVRPYTPQMNIPYPRPGHIVFSADESILVASGQHQGGLDAFQLSNLGDGEASPALSILTNGESLRALVANPSLDSPHLFALVTNIGELLMADLQTGGLRDGQSGSVLKSGITCCSWSNKGKQLVAGGTDGRVTQLKPDGTVVAQIPKSTSIPDGHHVSGVSWLENDTFFVIYTPSHADGPPSPSEYYIINRKPKTTDFTFQKLPEIVPPFGLERTPPFHFITRLRNFPPHIQDMLVLAASCSTDLGIITKMDESLSNDHTAGDFALTTIDDDSRRAVLPVGQNLADTAPIGMALDLSSTEKVPNPIPSDVELLETPTPVPALLVLTNEGHLLSWWIIYGDSVRQNTTFSGFETAVAASPDAGLSPPPTTSEPEPEKTSAPTSIFGQSSFSSFSKPSLSNFGSGNSHSTFGGSSDSAFGQTSTIGGSKASWTSTGFGSNTDSQTGGSGFGQPGFGQPSFGSAAPLGATSVLSGGSANSFGSLTSGFGKPLSGPVSSFGKPATVGSTTAFGASSTAIPFGAIAPKASGSSGFASFSQAGGFGGAKKDGSNSNVFAKASKGNEFGESSQESPFAANTGGFKFGTSDAGALKSTLGRAAMFKIDSSFKSDDNAKDDVTKPKNVPRFALSSLGDTLGAQNAQLSPTHDKEETGEDSGDASNEDENPKRRPFLDFSPDTQKQPLQSLVTPPSTLSQSKATPAPPVSSLFGTSNQQSTTPAAPSTTPEWSFGQLPSTTPRDTPAPLPSTTPKEPPAPAQKTLFGSVPKPNMTAPEIKKEPPSDEETVDMKVIPEAPLSPDPVSKPGFVTGDTSVSSLNSKATESPPDGAQLPPDFLPANRTAANDGEEAALPSDGEEGEVEDDDFSSDFEGSAEDEEGEISPIEEPVEEHIDELQTSPESSSKNGEKSVETSPTGGLFTKVSATASQKPVRPLFGEVGITGPTLPPPNPQQSPRSPSPVRNLPPTNALKADTARSVSAPAHPRSVIDKRKADHAQSQMALQAAQAREEEIAKQKERKAEEERKREQAEAEQLQRLEDNEDDRLRAELQAPVAPVAELDSFVTYQPKAGEEGSKSGIPAQIERLYQDINSMIYTLGINSRSLSAFMKYQQDQQPNESWPSVLKTDTPLDALNDEQVLDDTYRLQEGYTVLKEMLNDSQIHDVAGKLQDCENMLSQDLLELRSKLATIRKSLTLKATSENTLSAPLGADQASIQHDLRKSSALAQSKLVQVEDSLSVLRVRLMELMPSESASRPQSMFGGFGPRRKPTVEAVSNTVAKITDMAEKKSANIDVLEAELRKLDTRLSTVNGAGATPNGTPNKGHGNLAASTPKSGKSSVYHTPGSKFGVSARSTPSKRPNPNGGPIMIPAEDREKWHTKARRKKEMASVLVNILAERRKAVSDKS